ncbi:hypothetical protein TELCIR_15594 [Teladorsagia circumcincta]|uniref:Uncharacterized protein n=1 Tax=Teladorsagia circumcincta TaxID=45464 RepID=A0A2G9U028_TELCI|nr:hypothetical protein TELCIR_15594 [Teladorsagia circumcincta]
MKSAGDLEELLPEKRLTLQRNTVPFIKSVHYLICSMQFFSMSLLVIQHTGMPFLVRATNKVCIPAFAYAVQNNLYYIALANIDATTYTVRCRNTGEN